MIEGAEHGLWLDAQFVEQRGCAPEYIRAMLDWLRANVIDKNRSNSSSGSKERPLRLSPSDPCGSKSWTSTKGYPDSKSPAIHRVAAVRRDNIAKLCAESKVSVEPVIDPATPVQHPRAAKNRERSPSPTSQERIDLAGLR